MVDKLSLLNIYRLTNLSSRSVRTCCCLLLRSTRLNTTIIFYLRFGGQTMSAAAIALATVSAASQTAAAFALSKWVISAGSFAEHSRCAGPPKIKNLKPKGVVKITIKLPLFVANLLGAVATLAGRESGLKGLGLGGAVVAIGTAGARNCWRGYAGFAIAGNRGSIIWEFLGQVLFGAEDLPFLPSIREEFRLWHERYAN